MPAMDDDANEKKGCDRVNKRNFERLDVRRSHPERYGGVRDPPRKTAFFYVDGPTPPRHGGSVRQHGEDSRRVFRRGLSLQT